MKRLWIGFNPFAGLSLVHVGALAADAQRIASATTLMLMPALAIAARAEVSA